MKEDTVLQLTQLINLLPQHIRQFTEAEMSHRTTIGKWSKKEIIGHLIDSGFNNHRRFILAQIETQPYQLICYAQNDWVTLNHYQDIPIEEIVQLWALINRQIVNVIRYIPTPKLQYLCVLGDNTSLTLGWLIDDYLTHMQHHIRQIGLELEKAL